MRQVKNMRVHMYNYVRLSLLFEACCMLMFHASFSAQCDVESCASNLHHSLQMVTPHQVVTLEGLVRGNEMKHLMHVLSV